MIHPILVIEMIFKNLFNRNTEYKPVSFLTDILFYSGIDSLEYLFVVDKNAKILNTKNEVKILSEFSFNGLYFKIDFSGKIPKFLNNRIFLTFFMDKKISIYKNGQILYKDGFITSTYEDHETLIHNSIYFLGQKIKEKNRKSLTRLKRSILKNF